MSERTAGRRDALRKVLSKEGEGADALLVASVANVSYLSGFKGDSSVLLISPEREILISDGRYGEQLARECPEVEAFIRPVGQSLVEGISQVVEKLGLKKVAFEAAHLTVAQHLALAEKTQGITWRGILTWVERLRMVKDDHEIAAIREAVGIAERAFDTLRRGLGLGIDRHEKDIADDLEYQLRRCGATCASFPPIVAAGPNSALPHARPSTTTRLRDHDFVLVDWGASGRCYKSDLTRMIVTQKVSTQFESVYRAVLSAQKRAIEAIRPGRTGREIDTVARTSLADAGFGEQFTHSLGHGIGLELHEMPALGRDPDIVLERGVVVTIEPGVYIPGWGGVRIEDMVLVTEGGFEVLTSVPTQLDAIRLEV